MVVVVVAVAVVVLKTSKNIENKSADFGTDLGTSGSRSRTVLARFSQIFEDMNNQNPKIASISLNVR